LDRRAAVRRRLRRPRDGHGHLPRLREGTTSAWTADHLDAIEGNADLFVSPFRDDGATYGTPTQTWALVVDGDVYVRAASGADSSWYKGGTRNT
jgi:hypothetical protein